MEIIIFGTTGDVALGTNYVAVNVQYMYRRVNCNCVSTSDCLQRHIFSVAVCVNSVYVIMLVLVNVQRTTVVYLILHTYEQFIFIFNSAMNPLTTSHSGLAGQLHGNTKPSPCKPCLRHWYWQLHLRKMLVSLNKNVRKDRAVQCLILLHAGSI